MKWNFHTVAYRERTLRARQLINSPSACLSLSLICYIFKFAVSPLEWPEREGFRQYKSRSRTSCVLTYKRLKHTTTKKRASWSIIHSLNNIISMFLFYCINKQYRKLFIVIPTVYDIREWVMGWLLKQLNLIL